MAGEYQMIVVKNKKKQKNSHGWRVSDDCGVRQERGGAEGSQEPRVAHERQRRSQWVRVRL